MDIACLLIPEHQEAVLPQLDDEQRVLAAVIVINDPSVRVAQLTQLAQVPYAKLITALVLSAERDSTADRIWQLAYNQMDRSALVVGAFIQKHNAPVVLDRSKVYAQIAAHRRTRPVLEMYANSTLSQALAVSTLWEHLQGLEEQVALLAPYVTDRELVAQAVEHGFFDITATMFAHEQHCGMTPTAP
jgi:hypothetical protein